MTDTPGPLGPLVPGWTPRPRPPRAPLEGHWARLEPLETDRHGPSLWDGVRGADQIWTYMAYGPFAERGAFLDWLAARQVLDDPLTFAVIDRATKAVVGLLSLMEIRPEAGVIEVGHVLFSPALQRRTAATEAIVLTARHVFDDLGYRRFEWKCNALNEPSRRAALRYGFVFEGLFRHHQVVKGRNRDTAWFAMTEADWPARRAAFDRWLAPENFDAAGQQKTALAALTATLDEGSRASST